MRRFFSSAGDMIPVRMRVEGPNGLRELLISSLSLYLNAAAVLSLHFTPSRWNHSMTRLHALGPHLSRHVRCAGNTVPCHVTPLAFNAPPPAPVLSLTGRTGHRSSSLIFFSLLGDIHTNCKKNPSCRGRK
jgi:hypothetical protein